MESIAMPKPKPKQKPARDFKKELQTFGNRAMQWLFGVSQDWYKHRDIVKNNYQLGARFLKQGSAQDAILRFTFATWFDKTNADAWLGLGRAYLLAGKRAKAERALKKALQLNPAKTQAKKIVAAIAAVYDAPVPDIKMQEIKAYEAGTLAALHKESFLKAWDEKTFADMLDVNGTQAWMNGLVEYPMGFVVGRALGEQYEIITIAVTPEWRGRRLAKQLLETAIARAKELNAKTMFLEVADTNKAARKFYENAGFVEISRRKAYYRNLDGTTVDAIVMSRTL
jgi:ribosomal-protein-alanine N-acetyltransferase